MRMTRVRMTAAFLVVALAGAPAVAGPKNRQTARIMAGTASAVSGAVVLAGFVAAKDGDPFVDPLLYTGVGLLAVTPSLGQFYAGQYLTIGMGVRAAGAGIALYTLESYTQLAKCPLAPPSDPPECEILTEGAYPLLGLAAITFIGGVWYDVLDASDAVDRYNQKHGYTFAPIIVPAPQGPAPGVFVGGTF